jgi:mono/diheme cytochrome c family protein
MSATPSTPNNPGRASTVRLEQAAASDESITSVHAQLLHERPEPAEGFSPIPIFILFVFSGLIFFGGIYIGQHTSAFNPLAFDVTKKETGAATGPVAPPDPMVVGARLFSQNCAACHQPTGLGIPGTYPPLAGSEFVNGKEDRVIRIVTYGLQGPLEVEGKTFGVAQMPAFGPGGGYRWDEKKIAAVLTYVRASFGNTAPPVTPEKVKEVMGQVGSRPTPWTVQELEPYK